MPENHPPRKSRSATSSVSGRIPSGPGSRSYSSGRPAPHAPPLPDRITLRRPRRRFRSDALHGPVFTSPALPCPTAPAPSLPDRNTLTSRAPPPSRSGPAFGLRPLRPAGPAAPVGYPLDPLRGKASTVCEHEPRLRQVAMSRKTSLVGRTNPSSLRSPCTQPPVPQADPRRALTRTGRREAEYTIVAYNLTDRCTIASYVECGRIGPESDT